VNTGQVEALRALLASSGWLERTGHFARALRGRSRTPHGLLVVGTPGFEPWHMTAHLEDESRLAAPAGRHRQDRGGGQIADAARCGL